MTPPSTPPRALFASVTALTIVLVGASAVACGSDSTAPKPPTFAATLNGANEVPAKAVSGTGTALIVKVGTVYTYTINYTGLTSAPSAAHIHGPGTTAQSVPVITGFPVTGATGTSGTITGTFTSTGHATITTDSLDVLMRAGLAYVNVHTPANGPGEIRGQLTSQ